MRSFLALKVLLFTLMVPGTVIIYIPYVLISAAGGLPISGFPLNLLAGLLILAGMSIYLRCARDFAVEGLGTPAPIDPPKKLVKGGLYRFSRNPMYQGVLLLLFAECLLYPLFHLWLYAAVIALAFQLFIIFYEEPALRQCFGDCYADYCRKVPRWGFFWRFFSPNAE